MKKNIMKSLIVAENTMVTTAVNWGHKKKKAGAELFADNS